MFSTSERQGRLKTRSFGHFWLQMCFEPPRRALFRHVNLQEWSETFSFSHFWLGNVLRSTTACTFSTWQLARVVWDHQFLALLTWKCASSHHGVHFFDMSICKSGLRPSIFHTFDLEMCFAPQQRALFRHVNLQKWSETVSFWHFWLGNVLRATTACIFFISHLTTWLRTRRFSEPTLRPSGATNHWKTQWLATFLPFRAPGSSLLLFLLDLLTSSLLLSDSSHLCFSNRPHCRKFHF